MINRHWKTVCVIVGCWTFLALLFTPQTYLSSLRSPTPLTWGADIRPRSNGDQDLVLQNGQQLMLSRKYRDEFFALLGEL